MDPRDPGDAPIVNGADIRLGQLFDRESGRSFIAAFDHGVTLGPKPGSENVLEDLQRIIDGNPDGILISPGAMKIGGGCSPSMDRPVPIVRADWIYNAEVYPGLPASSKIRGRVSTTKSSAPRKMRWPWVPARSRCS